MFWGFYIVRTGGRNDFNVHCAGMISMAKGAIRVAKSGDMTDRNEIACVLKWCAPVLKTRHPCSEKLCGKNRLLDSQESVELWRITPKPVLSSHLLSAHAFYSMNVSCIILYILNFMDPGGGP
jgi:hypothetical protein